MAPIKKYYVGAKFQTKQGDTIEIVAFSEIKGKFIVKFEGYDVTKDVWSDGIQNGYIVNPMRPSLDNVGFLGCGPFRSSINNKPTKLYALWSGMIHRCYRVLKSGKPYYPDTTVCEEWHNFQNFCSWAVNHRNKILVYDQSLNYHVDKDLLCKNRDRVYSPDTCTLLPVTINSFLSNIRKSNGAHYDKNCNKYKATGPRVGTTSSHVGLFDTLEEAKVASNINRNEYAKYLANKFKDNLHSVGYEALMNFNTIEYKI